MRDGLLGRGHDLQPPVLGCAVAGGSAAAWAHVQKGLNAKSQNDREHMYVLAVAALYKDAGAGTKQSRDEAYREQMAATYAKYPDDETKLFYGLSILGTIREGAKGFEMQGRAIDLFESVYAHDKQHPGVLHYLIHAYDDPVHAERVSRRPAPTPKPPPRCRTRITCRHTSSRAWDTGTKRRRPTRTRGRFPMTM